VPLVSPTPYSPHPSSASPFQFFSTSQSIPALTTPRNLLSTSNNFTTYLSAYSVFLSSIAGVIITDYYLVRHGYLQIRDLYSASPSSPYFYTFGFHWRGYTAYICGILINIVGFVGAIGKPVPKGATYIYNLNFFCGFIVAGGTYWLLTRFSKIPATSECWNEVGDEISNVSVAYGVGEGVSDEESATGSAAYGKDDKLIEGSLKERKVAADF